MATYLVMNVAVMLLAVVVFCIKPRRPSRSWWLMIGLMLLLTAVFDALIIWAGIVEYAPEKLLGVYVGNVPIEDFCYTILAAIAVPALWQRTRKKEDARANNS